MKIAAKRNITFIVALALIIFNGRLWAQKNLSMKNPALPESLAFKARPVAASGAGQVIFISSSALLLQKPAGSAGLAFLATTLPMDFYIQHLGLVCKMEWAFERNSHLPLKFRLGSLEYVNFLEGKK